MNPFGKKLRELRKARGITLPALATAAGITKGYLSKIEGSPNPPTFSTLQAIAVALGVDLGELLEEQTSKPVSANLEIHEPGEGVWQCSEKLGGYGFLPLVQSYRNKYLSPFLMRIEPGETAHFKHDGEEFLYLLEGEVELEYEHRNYVLKTGTSVYLDSRIRHRFRNHQKKPALLLAINFVYRRF